VSAFIALPDQSGAARQQLRGLAELEHEVLGRSHESLFPAWAPSQQQALDQASLHPPRAGLEDTDLAATRWLSQPGHLRHHFQ
jgi:hypothetical protein